MARKFISCDICNLSIAPGETAVFAGARHKECNDEAIRLFEAKRKMFSVIDFLWSNGLVDVFDGNDARELILATRYQKVKKFAKELLDKISCFSKKILNKPFAEFFRLLIERSESVAKEFNLPFRFDESAFLAAS